MLNYLKSDKSVRYITDKNNDLSLSAKLLFNHGVLSQQTFEEITKFLYLLKSGKITSIQEDKIRILLRKIYPNVKFKKNLESIVKEFIKGASLDDIANDINELSKMHGFIHVSKEYRLVTKHLDFSKSDSDGQNVSTTPADNVIVTSPPAQLVNDLDKRIEKFKSGTEIVHFTKDEIKEIFAANGKAQPLNSPDDLTKIGGLDSELRNEVILNYLSTSGVTILTVDRDFVKSNVSLSMMDKAVQKNPSFISTVDDIIHFYKFNYIDVHLYKHLNTTLSNVLIRMTNDADIKKLIDEIYPSIMKIYVVLESITDDNDVVLNDKLYYNMIIRLKDRWNLDSSQYKLSDPLSEYSVELAYLQIKDLFSSSMLHGYNELKDKNYDKLLLNKLKERFDNPLIKTVLDFVANDKVFHGFYFFSSALKIMTGNEKIDKWNKDDFNAFVNYITPLFFTGSLTPDEEKVYLKFLSTGISISADSVDFQYLDHLGKFYTNPPSDKYEKYYNLFSDFSILTVTENYWKKIDKDEFSDYTNIKKVIKLYNHFKLDYLLSILDSNLSLGLTSTLLTYLKAEEKTVPLFLKIQEMSKDLGGLSRIDVTRKLFNAGVFEVPDYFDTDLRSRFIHYTSNDDKFINDPKFLDFVKDVPVKTLFVLSEANHIEKGLSDYILKKVVEEKIEYGAEVKAQVENSILGGDGLPKYKFYENLAELSTISDDSDLYESLFELYGTEYANALRKRVFAENLKKELYSSPIAPEKNLTYSEFMDILRLNNISVTSGVRRKKNQTIKEWLEELTKNQKTLPPLKIVKEENTPEDLEKLTAIINNKYNKRKHGDIAPKVVETFTTTFSDAQYQQFLKDNEGTEQIIPAFHGTGSVAASFILRNGFTIVKDDVAGIKVTGKALGNGIYFSNVLDKVTQYVGEGYSREIGTTGYVFEMKAALGEMGKDYKSGGLPTGDYRHWVSPEWAVFNPEKQLHIVKVMKVELVGFKDIDSYISKYKDSIVDESKDNMKTFNEFLNEKKNSYTGNTTRFIFRDENIPLSKEGTYIHYSKVDWKKLLGNRGWMEKTQDGVCVVFKSEVCKVYDVPYILKFFRDEKIRNDFYNLNRWL